eukprot:gb/GEZN01006808.1/.p2 GENE.gb/GEZN01006808.1/~~gb/GEZN01006808.1/.p2  ORF type:complete len:218 (-),score=37.77 gb/GEZN01006808.1/:91-744(-)
MASFCSLCRVEGTPEHVASGWHTYNTRMLAEGKVPQSKELYERYEKHKHEGSSDEPVSPPVVQQQTAAQKKNVNAWHWEEKVFTVWAHSRVEQLLKEVKVNFSKGTITIKTVTGLEGDACIYQRKGKKFIGFEMKCSIEWEGEISGEPYTAKGKATLPEISADSDPDEYQVINITTEGTNDHDELCRGVFRKEGAAAINKQLAIFASELRAKLKEEA